MTTPSYRIDVRPCIPVRWPDNSCCALGLRDVLCRAHQITHLTLPLPPALSVLLRVLTVCTARITGLDDPEMPLAQWHARRASLLRSGRGLDPAAVQTYLAAHCWDLYDARRPFLQDPALARQCARRTGINTLVFGRPAGNNLAWLGVHSDTAPHPLPSDEALWHLLIYHFYGPAGRCTSRTIAGTTSAEATSGPLRSTVSFHPLGATLLETLLLHLTPYRGDGQDTPDTCPWETDRPADPLAAPAPVTWPGRLLTGRSRHAALLLPSPDGSAAVDAYLTWALPHTRPKLPATDPYVIIDTAASRPAERRDTPRRADTDRAVWRDLDALLLAGDESATTRRPAVFDALNDLPEPARSRMQVLVCGFDQDSKTTNRAWYTARTPPIWIWAQERDAAVAQRIAACRTAAERLAAVLARSANTAWRAATTPTSGAGPPARPRRAPTRPSPWARAALAAYWPRAQTCFWDLVTGPRAHDEAIDAVFAAAALAALHRATVADLRRLRGAGPALARAAATIRAAASPTRPPRRGTGRDQP
ncbi:MULTISPECIES: type I-E CRISPR-associated protein Cse1/CasA [Streptomyces]|uniref:type I-E CRISPR-associated protein Cse1/CasA n=1 Tax=Streptomyces TaxID=1883 RepID=UPI000AFA3222|nr:MULTISPECIES: type I-E CRISPR-associated protein Cse1/CasA [Streptomyces]